MIRVWVLITAFLTACAAPQPSVTTRTTEPDQRAPVPSAPQTLVLSATNPIRSFGMWEIGNAGHFASVWNIHSNGLVTVDRNGSPAPRLAASLPSLADGSITVAPDGTMRTVWKLRPDARWQDGQPFTAADVVFAHRVMMDPEIPGERSAPVRNITSMEAVDANTVAMTWRTTFYRATSIDLRELWPLPSHRLAETFEADKKAFINLPYWTTEYFHVAPYRLVDFGLGEELLFERVPDFFLGAPKIDRIVFRTIGDPNALFANLRAGSVDMALELALSPSVGVELRDEWARTGGGVVMTRQGALRYLKVQSNAEWARYPELSRDPRLRQALYRGLDRDSIRETLWPGFPDTEPDTFMLKADPRAGVVGKPFARYPYEPARATRELAEAGWQRGADGRIVDARGEVVQVPIRTSVAYTTEMAAAADNWRRLGLDPIEEVDTAASARDPEYQAKFPGFVATARGTGDGIFPNFDSRTIPNAQNRYTGQNIGGYTNSALDRLVDQLYGEIESQKQATLLRDLGEILATEMPALPLYFRVEMTAVAKGISGISDDYPGSSSGTIARNVHLWDKTPG
jgi:peptide/nickel transport system substrate-binding protein